MNILFLDIDGVLNPCDGSGLNTDKVALLKEICDATDCRIVLSSSWRLNERQLDRVAHMLMVISSFLWSVTPDLTLRPGTNFKLHRAVPRWMEIDRWVGDSLPTAFPDFRNGFQAVILDDEADMGPLSHLHVRTDSHTGLTPELAREIISRFNGNPTTPKP
jgi:hypothetical protein